MLKFIFILLILTTSASADQLFVAPNGSDASQCDNANPCATISRACTVSNNSPDRRTSISVAPGVYVQDSCNVFYHHLVGVVGDCNNHPQIVLAGNDVAFWGQDDVILTVQCIDVWSTGYGSIAFASRQFTIIDVNFAKVGPLLNGTVLAAEEKSKINCGAQLTVAGSVAAIASAGDTSTISLSCPIVFQGPVQVNYVVEAVQGSIINASAATWFGSVTGQQYYCNHSEIDGAPSLPGSPGTAINYCVLQ